jgi:3-dehydroquinate dehydratase type I
VSKPRICVSITENNPAAIKKAAPLADLFEVRIDLIGKDWWEVAKHLDKPWIACNRLGREGGKSHASEEKRISELLDAFELGASIVDIELGAPNLKSVVERVKGKVECLVSFHDYVSTPPFETLVAVVTRQLAAGADICKVVTTARSLSDNLALLQLPREFPGHKVISFSLGAEGQISRVLCPLAGGYLTYASLAEGKESAPGQITVDLLRKIYGVTGHG